MASTTTLVPGLRKARERDSRICDGPLRRLEVGSSKQAVRSATAANVVTKRFMMPSLVKWLGYA